MILTEIIHETKERARIKARRNSTGIIIIGSMFGVVFTTIFYSFGIPQQDHIYGSVPVLASIPLVLLMSFNAVGISSIMFFFFWALGESTHYVVKNSLEQRKENQYNEQSKSIYDKFNQYGQKDYSLQIDETKQGLKHEISESVKEIPTLKNDIAKIKNEKASKEELDEWKKLSMDEYRNVRLELIAEREARKNAEAKIIEKDEFIKKLLSEQSKTETTEKDAQIIKKDNRLESI